MVLKGMTLDEASSWRREEGLWERSEEPGLSPGALQVLKERERRRNKGD